jgi:hypothetical protein
MEVLMKVRFSWLVILGEIALLYNLNLVGSVVLNLAWVRTRAAGGQFENFPIGIRIAYFFTTLLMLFFMAMLWNHRVNPLQKHGPLVAKIIGYQFLVSTFFQLISRSPDERWNAFPALLLAYVFFQLAKRDKNEKEPS